MTIAIIRFGGSNCDRDTLLALEHLDIDATIVWHEDGLPDGTTGIILPGGFSYGDYLRAGAMAAQSPIMEEINQAVSKDIPLLGICNGAQIGCEGNFTPGTFTTNQSARFQCEHVHVRVETTETMWTQSYSEGDVLEIPIAHGEGRFEINNDQLETLESAGEILFRYCTPSGEITEEANPNGSKGNVAGVVGTKAHVAVMMPHPERATLPDIGLTDGAPILEAFR